jgi:pilus assembly protein Flp/PilA
MIKSYFALQTYLKALLTRDDRGATAVEYGLIVFFIAVAIIAGITLLGTNLNTLFTNIAGDV